MTELQYGLIGLGGLAVAGVVAYNKWQEYRHRKVAESVLRPEHDDVLLKPASRPSVAPVAAANERVEPVFAPPVQADEAPQATNAPPVPAEPEPATDVPPRDLPPTVEAAVPDEPEVSMPEPVVEPVPEPLAEPVIAAPVTEAPLMPPPPASEPLVPPVLAAVDEVPSAEPVPAELLDPRLEFIVSMELVEPVSSRQILQSQRDVLQRVSRPVHFVAYNERAREWIRLRSDNEIPVRCLRVGLQLVNRLGPVSDGELAVFTGAMQALADELMAVADMPTTRVLERPSWRGC